MTNFAGKAIKAFLLSMGAVLLLTASAFAAEADIAVAVGATTGSSLRLRSEPSTSSSIITLLNEGVAVSVLDNTLDGWYKISYNGNTGFVSADYMIIDKDNVFETYGRVNGDGVNLRPEASTESEALTTLNSGTVVTVTGFQDGWFFVTCEDETQGYIRSDFLNLTSSATSHEGIVATAMAQLGTRYKWGGSAPGGFDCSGFTMYVYGQHGYTLPHTATGQWKSGIGTKVYSISELQPGDLVLFNDPSRNAGKACSHVGIYIGNGQHIHASSSSKNNGVVISSLTSGYYNQYFIGGIHP